MAPTDSQTYSTTTGQYDQIFALSQGYLNKSFSELYKNTLGETNLHTLNVKNISGKIEATIGEPQIAIDIYGDKNVIFYINFTGGHLSLRDNESGDWIDGMPDGGFPLAGCRVAFKVNISLEGIPPSDPKYQSIMDRVHHEEAANYSLSKLFMDLTAVEVSSVLGAPDTILPHEVIAADGDWISFVNKWLEVARHHGVNLLGYQLTANKSTTLPTTFAPTFQPVWNAFQTSEWHFADNKPKQGIPDGHNNSLMYLQMTLPHDPPADSHYVYTGNMVGDGESGSLFISRKLFWDKFLLPVLRHLNYSILFQPTNAHCSNNEADEEWEWHWAVGNDAAKNLKQVESDSFYDFKENQAGLDWTFDYQHRESDSGGIWGSRLGCYIDATNNVTVSFQPGSNTISVKGDIEVTIERDTTAAGTAHAWVHAPWSFDIELSALSNEDAARSGRVPGGIDVSLTPIVINLTTDEEDSSATQKAPTGCKDDISNALNKIDFKNH